jgi:hypothetical protein
MRRRALLRILAVLGLAALAGAGCLSPTLPIPPPEPPDTMRPAATPGHWQIAGDCSPGALVTVLDERTGRGAVVQDLAHTGRYLVDVEAEACDAAWVMQEVDGQPSGQTGFVIGERTPNGAADAGACR